MMIKGERKKGREDSKPARIEGKKQWSGGISLLLRRGGKGKGTKKRMLPRDRQFILFLLLFHLPLLNRMRKKRKGREKGKGGEGDNWEEGS